MDACLALRKIACFLKIHKYSLFGYGSVDGMFWERCNFCGLKRRTNIRHCEPRFDDEQNSLCSDCWGSGEGMYSDSICSKCKGSGVKK